MQYVVLRTIAPDGTRLTHLPTADRIVSEHADWWDALIAARALRTATYQHRQTDERRTYNENQTAGCAYHDDQTVWRFVAAASYLTGGGYALALERSSLPYYEPAEVTL